MQGKVVYGSGAEGLGALFACPVRVREVFHTGEEVGAAVAKHRQEKRGRYRRSWKRSC